jgi:hypothetical protein
MCFFSRHFLRAAAGLAPAPINLFFDPTAKKEDGKNKWHTDENDAPFGDPTHHADAGSEPSAGCRGQSMDAFAMAAANDHARAEKADPGQDALDDATDGVDLAAVGHRHDSKRGAQSNQAERSQSGWLVVQVTVESERATDQ